MSNVSKTSYIDAYGDKQTGYIINGSTYADELGQNSVGIGSIVTAGDGQKWVKLEGPSQLYDSYLQENKITPTTYVDAAGNQKTGFIINGTTFTDVTGLNPVGVGSVVNAGGTQWYKGENGSMPYSDYLKQQQTTKADEAINQYKEYYQQQSQQQTPTISGSETLSGLQEMLATTQQAYDKAVASNDTVYAAQLQKSMADIQNRINELNEGYKNLNVQLYRDYMMSKKNMPQALAAQGINGGLSESTLLGLETGYQGNLAANERNRLSGIKDIENNGADAELELAIAKAEADAAAGDVYAERRLAILQALQEQQNYERELQLESEQRAYEQSVTEAQLAYQQAAAKAENLAQYGDFSGYAELGYTAQEIANMTAAYKAAAEAALGTKSSSGGSSGNVPGGSSGSVSGGSSGGSSGYTGGTKIQSADQLSRDALNVYNTIGKISDEQAANYLALYLNAGRITEQEAEFLLAYAGF